MATKNAGAKKGAKGATAKEPSAAARKAAAEQQVPLEPVGPGTEHEDHEGGLTDSLAKKGVRAALPIAEEREEQAKEDAKDGIIRAPSVRERQTGLQAAVAHGGAVAQRDELDAKGNVIARPRGAAQVLAARPGARIIPVIATRLGHYPADGRLRAPGEAFDYVMSEKELKLPSWVKDPTRALESRQSDEPSALPAESVLVEVKGTGPGATATVTRDRKVI